MNDTLVKPNALSIARNFSLKNRILIGHECACAGHLSEVANTNGGRKPWLKFSQQYFSIIYFLFNHMTN